MKYTQRSRAGFTLVEIMIVVAIIGLLAAIALPNFMRARKNSQSSACINNLRQIDGAKHQWALETSQRPTATPVQADLQPYMGRGSAGTLNNVYCPLVVPGTPMAGYTINQITTPPTCANYDVADHPARMD